MEKDAKRKSLGCYFEPIRMAGGMVLAFAWVVLVQG